VSYGLYLWHWPLIRAAEDVPVGPLSRTILAFGATFIIAAISFYWYERPFLRLKERFVAGKSGAVSLDRPPSVNSARPGQVRSSPKCAKPAHVEMP
jgi:peptidoglycan/LPS O-acetylase OafA/YrhL